MSVPKFPKGPGLTRRTHSDRTSPNMRMKRKADHPRFSFDLESWGTIAMNIQQIRCLRLRVLPSTRMSSNRDPTNIQSPNGCIGFSAACSVTAKVLIRQSEKMNCLHFEWIYIPAKFIHKSIEYRMQWHKAEFWWGPLSTWTIQPLVLTSSNLLQSIWSKGVRVSCIQGGETCTIACRILLRWYMERIHEGTTGDSSLKRPWKGVGSNTFKAWYRARN